jgi:signal transduction histidine kinase
MAVRRTLGADVGTELPPITLGAPALRRFLAAERGLLFWGTLWLLVAAAEFGALVPVLFDRGTPVTTDGVIARLLGGSFAACGLIAWRRRPDSRVGPLMTATGLALFIVPLLTQLNAAVAQTIAYQLSELWSLLFVTLILTFATGGRVTGRVDRALIGLFVLPLIVLQFVFLLFAAEDLNLLNLFGDAGVADAIDKAQRVLIAASSLIMGAVIAQRWSTASKPRRRVLAPSVAGLVCLLLFAVLLVSDLFQDPGTRLDWLLWIVLCSTLIVPGAFLVGLLRSRLARGGLADVFRGLATVRGEDLQGALARVLGDPSLRIGYRLPGSRGYADADDRPLLVPPAEHDRAWAPVEWEGRHVAALVFDASLEEDPELVEAVSAAAAIALENERLHVESDARLSELHASRERIVSAGDAERRRLERNLHDGAQQRLVAIALQLRLLQEHIREDPALAERLAQTAGDEVGESLAELRELARGLHPAVLDYGLTSALESVASRSAVPTEVTVELSDPPLPKPIELAAYFVACESLANIGKYADASVAHIRVWRDGLTVSIEIADDGVGGADVARGSGLRGLADRVDALDGCLRVSSPLGAGTVVTAELPCAS